MRDDYCSETETEGGGISENPSNACESPEVSKPAASRPNMYIVEESDDLVPLAKLIRQKKNLLKFKTSKLDTHDKHINTPCNSGQASSGDSHRSCSLQSVGRKRVRVVISDDEAELDDIDEMRKQFHGSLIEDMATSDKG